MNSYDPWKPFQDVMQDPWAYAREWKERTRGKVIGHLLPDVPEEIIHAAGALPVAIEGAGTQISRAQAHIPGYTCSHAMGAMEMRLKGDLDVLDGMIIPYVCDTTRNLFHVWDRCFPDMANEFLRLPKRVGDPRALSYLRAEFARLLESVGTMTGRAVSPDDLAASISLYNRSRARLREAYRLASVSPEIWTTSRVQLLLASALRASREEHLGWMEALPWDAAPSEAAADRIPLYVKGKVWDPPVIAQMLDELGFTVVRDEIVTGFRSVEQDAPLDGEPLAALLERHERTVPYAGYHQEPSEIVKGFSRRVRESGARGVLFLNPKFCEAAAFDTPDLLAALEEENLPRLVLETSARGVSPEQVRLRLEAFQELLAGDLP
jgi:bcr-type benzoyl-CoA reductase subunit C